MAILYPGNRSFVNPRGLYDNAGSYNFDGVADYGEADSVSSTLDSDTVGSISCWARPATVASGTDTVFSFASTGSGFYFFIYRQAATLTVGLWNGGSYPWVLKPDVDPWAANTWMHVGVIQNGVSPIVTVGGVQVAQTFTQDNDRTQWCADGTMARLKLGAIAYNSSLKWAGHLDDFAYFRTALSVANMATIAGDPLMRSTAQFSPFLHYRMDAQMGTSEPNVGSDSTPLTLASDTGWDNSEVPS